MAEGSGGGEEASSTSEDRFAELHTISQPQCGVQVSSVSERLESQGAERRTPWLVPVDQPLELLFFHAVFVKLRACMGLRAGEEAFVYGVPLVAFQRAMSRLFHVLGEDHRCFDAKPYDVNGDGTVGWWEFCMLWKEEQPSVRLSLPERVFLTLESPEMSRLGRIMSFLVLTTIFISAGGFIISTLPSLQEQPCEICEPEPFAEFTTIDTVCVILFTLEYIARLVTSAFMRMELPIMNQEQIIHLMCTDELIRWPTKLQRVWDFVRAPPNLIDLAAILPSYIAWCMPKSAPEDGGDSSMVILKLIRLMRVVRAFRLGRRFEAVIIIARSMHRSTRALWVLILNMTIGTVVFGAVMFFVEQGTYDPHTQRYIRPGSWTLNRDTQRYERAQEDSPFESIPHAFWWALVTATTAGYGDMAPTTLLGKVTAGICMIWSLCVIALPVGVIGSNFESVWEEFDTEKMAESELRENETKMQRNMMASIEPLLHSALLRIEVYHDSCMATPDNDTFIGEAEARMKIQPSSQEPVDHHVELPLRANTAKSDIKVTGRVYLHYSWRPSARVEPGVLLDGELVISILRAEDLAQVDWKAVPAATSKPESDCDPYVVLTVYPSSPSKDGVLTPKSEQSGTIFDSRTPTWNERMTFQFRWTNEGVLARRASAKREFLNKLVVAPGPCQDTGESNADTCIVETLPQIMSDLEVMRQAAPELFDEVREVKQATRSLLVALGLAEGAGSMSRPDHKSRGTPTSSGVSTLPVEASMQNRSEEQSQPGSRQPSPRPEADADFQFVVPGMIAEEPNVGAEEADPVVAAPSGGPG